MVGNILCFRAVLLS